VITETAITYRVWHRTDYRYVRQMTDGYTALCLTPRDTSNQRVIEHSIAITPDPDVVDTTPDAFGNETVQVGVHRPHDHLVIEATSTVEVVPPPRPAVETPWEEVRDQSLALLGEPAVEVSPFRGSSPFVPIEDHRAWLYALASQAFTPDRPIVEAVTALCHEIFTTFEFDPSFSELSTPLADVLAARRGVCQDFAHLSVGALRTLGLPARYVSGYIETDPPEGEPRTFGADASHAWCAAWIGDYGWLDFDPTNDHVPAHRHVTIGWGRDYGDVTPVRGVVIGPSTEQSLYVSVDVARLS
jgi:transglutaminase-like putative cysteine protease